MERTIRFQCPYCNSKLKVPQRSAGVLTLCPNEDCKRQIKVPSQSPEELVLVGASASTATSTRHRTNGATNRVSSMLALQSRQESEEDMYFEEVLDLDQTKQQISFRERCSSILKMPLQYRLIAVSILIMLANVTIGLIGIAFTAVYLLILQFIGSQAQKVYSGLHVRNINIAVGVILILASGTALAMRMNGPPSDDVIKWAAYVYIHPDASIVERSTVIVEEIGNYNSDGKYWPVRVLHNDPLLRAHYRTEYAIFKDDFGEWKARRLRTR